MSIYPLDIFLLIYFLAGTLAIKQMQKQVAKGAMDRLLFLAITVVMIPLPLLAIKLEIAPYSALSVVFGGICLFWFAILSSRGTNAT